MGGELIHHHGDVVATFVGRDSLTLAALTQGPRAVHRALLADDLDMARSERTRIYPLVDSVMSARFLHAVKAATKARGLAVGDPPEPVTAFADRRPDKKAGRGAAHTG